MGKVIVSVKLTNQGDLMAVHRKLSTAKPRTTEVEALVDTGATRLYLNPSVIKVAGTGESGRGCFANHQRGRHAGRV